MADKTKVLMLVPPVRARVRSSHTNPETVAALIHTISPEGTWGSDGETYPTYKPASNASQVHRRAVANALRVPVAMIRSKVWETSDAFPPVERDKPGAWVFALARKVTKPVEAPAEGKK